ncbi:MAG: Gfo/Idh/MocA family protein [Planctomycetota bacterium]|jgi:predicted dehydrogenase
MKGRTTRRAFAKTGAAAAALAATFPAPSAEAGAVGANERIRLGFIGVANRGGQLINAFLKHDDVEVAALCDVDRATLAGAAERFDGKAALYGDFRQLLGRRDVDAVVIATPDHWHAVQTITACDAGKDVYVEKPLSITVREGQRMVEAARAKDRVVQVGTHMRSSTLYAGLRDAIASDRIGKVTVSRCFRLSNMYPHGMGRSKPSDPPKTLDWDMWLGPRPERPYQDNITPYKFRWWTLYSSQMANWGVHFLDLMRWLTGELAPASISAMGGRFAVDDDRTIPDTMQTTFEFASGRLGVFGQYEACGNPALPLPDANLEFRGTLGTAYLRYLGGQRVTIVPERGGQFQEPGPRCDSMERDGTDGDLTVKHARNFLDCIKSRRRPAADVEIGHRSTSLALLANISLVAKARIEWDAQRGVILEPKEANELLHYEYRKPWRLE